MELPWVEDVLLVASLGATGAGCDPDACSDDRARCDLASHILYCGNERYHD